MRSFVNLVASWNLKRRIHQIENFIAHPMETQTEHFAQIIRASALTEWGEKYGYSDIETIADFQRNVPISTYEDLFPYIERMLKGEPDILWHGVTTWFAKSSGTTNDKSKYIPISEESLYDCHYKAGKDLLGIYFHNHPESNLFSGKILSIGGSHELSNSNEDIRCGDLSAVLLENLPFFYELVRTPSKKVALMSNWEEKLEAMCNEVINEDVRGIVGVPTWTLLLIQQMLEKRNIPDKNLAKIWANLEAFFHGGINFDPYKTAFQSMYSRPISFVNIYNASEGFFGIQNEKTNSDMLLMLDYGIFYEFIDMRDFGSDSPKTYTIDEVELGKNYALLITTNGGLWRYLIGDTIAFTSLSPHKIKITGRTKHFINAFGEELMVDNADKAILAAANATNAHIKDYTAAPFFLAEGGGGHEWLIEFEQMPEKMEHFENELDTRLKQLNSDYEAKRTGDLVMKNPIIHVVAEGTFYDWMKKRGRLGGQNKIPRLANNRLIFTEILTISQQKRQIKNMP